MLSGTSSCDIAVCGLPCRLQSTCKMQCRRCPFHLFLCCCRRAALASPRASEAERAEFTRDDLHAWGLAGPRQMESSWQVSKLLAGHPRLGSFSAARHCLYKISSEALVIGDVRYYWLKLRTCKMSTLVALITEKAVAEQVSWQLLLQPMQGQRFVAVALLRRLLGMT